MMTDRTTAACSKLKTDLYAQRLQCDRLRSPNRIGWLIKIQQNSATGVQIAPSHSTHRLARQIPRTAVAWPSVGIAAGGCEAGVSDRGLHQVRRGAAVKGVADVGVPEPVRLAAKQTTGQA